MSTPHHRPTSTAPGDIRAGEAVEVFIRFNDSWVGGYEVAAAHPDGYEVRRSGDRSPVPGRTPPADVRRVR